jgi:hypothetical protein
LMVQLGLSALSAVVVAAALVIRRAVGRKRLSAASVAPDSAASSASRFQ